MKEARESLASQRISERIIRPWQGTTIVVLNFIIWMNIVLFLLKGFFFNPSLDGITQGTVKFFLIVISIPSILFLIMNIMIWRGSRKPLAIILFLAIISILLNLKSIISNFSVFTAGWGVCGIFSAVLASYCLVHPFYHKK
jgi:hypothetical protein